MANAPFAAGSLSSSGRNVRPRAGSRQAAKRGPPKRPRLEYKALRSGRERKVVRIIGGHLRKGLVLRSPVCEVRVGGVVRYVSWPLETTLTNRSGSTKGNGRSKTAFSAGNLYGTTTAGCSDRLGTVFEACSRPTRRRCRSRGLLRQPRHSSPLPMRWCRRDCRKHPEAPPSEGARSSPCRLAKECPLTR